MKLCILYIFKEAVVTTIFFTAHELHIVQKDLYNPSRPQLRILRECVGYIILSVYYVFFPVIFKHIVLDIKI